MGHFDGTCLYFNNGYYYINSQCNLLIKKSAGQKMWLSRSYYKYLFYLISQTPSQSYYKRGIQIFGRSVKTFYFRPGPSCAADVCRSIINFDYSSLTSRDWNITNQFTNIF